MKISEIRQNSIKFIKSAFLSSGNESLKSQAETASLDVDVIISHFTGRDRTWVLFHRDFELDCEAEKKIWAAVEKRKTGLPVAYITSRKEFYGLDFYVNPSVLIPKPDTEVLVDFAVDEILDKYPSSFSKNLPLYIPLVCDMCAGSGCVGLSVLKELERRFSAQNGICGCADFLKAENLPKFVLADLSLDALEVAKKNAQSLLGGDLQRRVRFVQSNLFEQIPFVFDVIVTNPPYVPHSQSVELLTDGRSEPLLALDGDVDENGNPSGSDDGLALIRRLVPECYAHLSKNGVLLMETGEYNAEETAELFKKAGFRNVHIELDLSEKMRDVIGTK